MKVVCLSDSLCMISLERSYIMNVGRVSQTRIVLVAATGLSAIHCGSLRDGLAEGENACAGSR